MKKCKNPDCENLVYNNRTYCSHNCLKVSYIDCVENTYNNNPKCCRFCGEIIPYVKRENIFCNSSCAAAFNNTNRKGKYDYTLSDQGLIGLQKNQKDILQRINKTSEQKKLFYYKNPKKCAVCCSIIKYEDKKKKFCSTECKSEHIEKNLNAVSQKLSNSLRNFYLTEEGLINRKNLSNINTGKFFSEKTREKLSKKGKERCDSLEERNRLREIGRKGGFGKKGYTENGQYYQSSFEQKCFEYLEKLNIVFEAHKNLPNSSKISDIYLPKQDLWIELDGIDREKRKKYLGKSYEYWLEKLNLYKSNKLDYIIVYTFDSFKKIIGR